MSRHIQITFDAHDPHALSLFWRDALGEQIRGSVTVWLIAAEIEELPRCRGRYTVAGSRRRRSAARCTSLLARSCARRYAAAAAVVLPSRRCMSARAACR